MLYNVQPTEAKLPALLFDAQNHLRVAAAMNTTIIMLQMLWEMQAQTAKLEEQRRAHEAQRRADEEH